MRKWEESERRRSVLLYVLHRFLVCWGTKAILKESNMPSVSCAYHQTRVYGIHVLKKETIRCGTKA
jgi:hypothetical protein